MLINYFFFACAAYCHAALDSLVKIRLSVVFMSLDNMTLKGRQLVKRRTHTGEIHS